MGWARLDDKRAMNRKLRAAGFAARGLDEAAICQIAGDETDGFISIETVEMLAQAHRERRWQKLVDALVAAERWDPVEGGWMVRNYLEFNPSHAQLEARRQADRQRKGGRHSSGIPPGVQTDSAVDSDRSPPGRQADSAADSAADSDRIPLAPSRPVPTRPSSSSSRGSSPAGRPASDDDDDERLRQAKNLVARRRLARREAEIGPVGNPEAWVSRVADAIEIDRFDVGNGSVEVIAARIEHPSSGHEPEPDDVPCPTCGGQIWLAVENSDEVVRCPTCAAR